MEKIKVAELLKDCPKGMELDCTMYDNLYLDKVEENYRYPIGCYTIYDGCRTFVNFTEFGEFNSHAAAKCVIFPKGKTTWKGFVPPCRFKDGDIVTSIFQGVVQGTGIFDYKEQSEAWVHVCINLNNEFSTDGYLGYVYNLRLATEEEKQKLFQAIKYNGYKWNAETKTLEKLVAPKFKVGDRIKSVMSSSYYTVVDIMRAIKNYVALLMIVFCMALNMYLII